MQLTRHVWERYSNKLKKRFLSMQYAGAFSKRESEEKGVRLVVGKEGSLEISLLVDLADGVILDAAFQAFGPSALLVAADVACELVMRRTYLMAKSLSADNIDQALRDHPSTPAFPQETFSYLNLVLFALDEALSGCMDIPLDDTLLTTPFSFDASEATSYPNWENLSKDAKLTLIEELLDKDIRPFIAMDGGGVHIKEFRDEKELLITYEGSCTSCYAATGSTLTSIQQLLQGKLHPSLIVIPDESVLSIHE